MKIIIGILAIIALAYCCGLSINFKPFSISFIEWKTFLGFILISIGVSFINEDVRKKSFNKGILYGGEYVINKIKNELKNK